MHQNRHAGEPEGALGQGSGCPVGGRRQPILLGPGHAFDHRVHRFEVGGVRRHGDGELLAGTAMERAAGALVVLHVPRSLHRFGIEIALELLENLAVRLPHDVGQDVEPAAMGHAHDHFGHPGPRRGIEQGVQEDDG